MGLNDPLFFVSFRLFAPTTAAMGLLVGCNDDPKEQITLQVGPEQVYRFDASSGFAHYYELPGQEDVLRIILASYPLGCQDYSPPEPGDVFVTLTLRAPATKTIGEGVYAWEGLTLHEGKEPEEEEAKAPRPWALPYVRLAEDARALPPGGALKLTKFEPETYGQVEGDLRFRDAAPGQATTTALMGEFSVRLCHLELDEARRSPPQTD